MLELSAPSADPVNFLEVQPEPFQEPLMIRWVARLKQLVPFVHLSMVESNAFEHSNPFGNADLFVHNRIHLVLFSVGHGIAIARATLNCEAIDGSILVRMFCPAILPPAPGPGPNGWRLTLFPLFRVDDNSYRTVVDEMNFHIRAEFSGLHRPAKFELQVRQELLVEWNRDFRRR